jgi:hypothetical protein
LIIVLVFSAFGNAAFAQKISLGGQFGYAKPLGKSFENSNGGDMASFGLCVDVDVLYHFEKLSNKLGLGLTYNSSFLFGASTNDNLEIGIYSLNLYGVKAQYKFFATKVTPYFSLSTGYANFSTPEITDDKDNVISKGENAGGFGCRPELGLNLGGFVMSAAYFVPMEYSITKATAGSFQVSLGFRKNF